MSANKQRRCLNLAGEDEPCNHPWNGDGRGTTMSTPTSRWQSSFLARERLSDESGFTSGRCFMDDDTVGSFVNHMGTKPADGPCQVE